MTLATRVAALKTSASKPPAFLAGIERGRASAETPAAHRLRGPAGLMTLAGQTRARAALPGLRAGCDEQRAPYRLTALPPQHSLLLRRHREAGGSEP